MSRVVWYSTSFLCLSVSLLVLHLNKGPLNDVEDCFISRTCFGDDWCPNINKLELRFDTIVDFLNTFFSVKNVYRASYLNESVILKKSRPTTGFEANRDDVLKLLLYNSDLKDFVVCDSLSGDDFVNVLQTFGYNLSQIYNMVDVHVEPLLLKIFNNESHWRVAKLLGLCGRLSVVTDCGKNLNEFKTSPWNVRAYLAIQILESALNFTLAHERFSLYLTDISADNIAVNDEYKIAFVDLENGILAKRNGLNETVHYTHHFQDNEYVFSVGEICGHHVSDHNIYSVCRLLLSTYSPWPMMEGGLLHSPPNNIVDNYKGLLNDIEKCVWSDGKLNRFDLAIRIITLLRNSLTDLHKQGD